MLAKHYTNVLSECQKTYWTVIRTQSICDGQNARVPCVMRNRLHSLKNYAQVKMLLVFNEG